MRGYFTTALLVCVTVLSMHAATRPDVGRRAALDAAMDGDARVVRRAADGGLNLRQEGPCLLCAAALLGRTEVVRVLLDRGVPPDAGMGNVTPLMLAAQRDHVATAALLLEAGADPSRTTTSGQTALEFARESGGPEILALLEAWAAPPSTDAMRNPRRQMTERVVLPSNAVVPPRPGGHLTSYRPSL